MEERTNWTVPGEDSHWDASTSGREKAVRNAEHRIQRIWPETAVGILSGR